MLVTMLALIAVPLLPSAAVAQPGGLLKVEYVHFASINGQEGTAHATGVLDLSDGTVTVDGFVSDYIEGYAFWPVSWLTLIMTSVAPIGSLEQGGAFNLHTITAGELGYKIETVTEDDFANVTTSIEVTLEGGTVRAVLSSEGEAKYPEIIGMDGPISVAQIPNDEGFEEVFTKRLIAADGSAIESRSHNRYLGTFLPFPQMRDVTVVASAESTDRREVSLLYESVVRPQRGDALDGFFYASGERVPIRVEDDQIGVLLVDGASPRRLAPLAAEHGLEIIQELPGGIVVLAAGPRSPEELSALALELRSAVVVTQAGLVAYPLEAETPLILTDEIIVQLRPDIAEAEVEGFVDVNGLEILMENPFVDNQFLMRVRDRLAASALDAANRAEEDEQTIFAHPNFVRVLDLRQTIPNDPRFGNQWHHRNTGQSGGTVDADIDSELAWDISQGNANVVISVIDSGFDAAHPDLVGNLWANPGEVAGDGADNDGNGFVDDVNGWDFTGCTATTGPICGDNTLAGGNHGTAVAGSAAADGNNNIGVTGSCWDCSMMLLRLGGSVFGDGLAFGYAQQMGADIITNSWGYPIGTPTTTNVVTAINNAATAGSVILFAMNNTNVNDCTGATPDISSIPNVIAISRSTNQDQFDFSGFGNCMDLLAPSAGLGTVAAGRGTLWATTTDRVGTAGYNNTSTSTSCPSAEPAPPPTNARDYTNCFNGTSFATPLTAGVAGLILGASPALTRIQVQRLLQDTADKIEDSTGNYSPATGFSAPGTPVTATHGWGRVNAFEAVRLAAPIADGGRAGVDVFVRDNRLDWGNTEQPSNTLFEATRGSIGHWRSMDIKVDSPVDGFRPAPTAASFDAFVDESPSAVPGDMNRVYVRIRNRGPNAASTVNVKLHWAQFGTALPPLPTDFWTAFPNDSSDTSQWHPLDCAAAPPTPLPSTVCQATSLTYSGASVATTAADGGQIVRYDFPAPAVDPMLANHFCLLVIVDSPQDPVSPDSKATAVVDAITPNDNNVTHRNYSNLSTSRGRDIVDAFIVRNPFQEPITSVLRVDPPEGWEISADPLAFGRPFTLEPNQEVLVEIRVSAPAPGLAAEFDIVQEQLAEKGRLVLGGVTLAFQPEAPAEEAIPAGPVTPFLIGTFDLRDEANTWLHILNPTAQRLRVLALLTDAHEQRLTCIQHVLDPNGVWEVDIREHAPRARFGIVKIIALNANERVPEVGIVGNQRVVGPQGIAETALHPAQQELLETELPIAIEACG